MTQFRVHFLNVKNLFKIFVKKSFQNFIKNFLCFVFKIFALFVVSKRSSSFLQKKIFLKSKVEKNPLKMTNYFFVFVLCVIFLCFLYEKKHKFFEFVKKQSFLSQNYVWFNGTFCVHFLNKKILLRSLSKILLKNFCAFCVCSHRSNSFL